MKSITTGLSYVQHRKNIWWGKTYLKNFYIKQDTFVSFYLSHSEALS